MPPINLLIKPASSNCNLRCTYCFYHSLADNRVTRSYGIMQVELLETVVKKALEFADHVCTFAFQGGEPTLAGLEFYKKLIELEKKHNDKGVQVNYAIQTNGLAINEEWAEFLAENHFLVGISLDGPKDIHDINRIDAKSEGSFNRVMHAIQLFNKYKVEYNVLFVVNGMVARHANQIYKFFKKNNFQYLQFIPCLDPLNEAPGNNAYSLKPERFTQFLKNLFDLWYEDGMKGSNFSIRYFDNLVGILAGYKPEACGMLGECQCQFVMEADGGVYPCDFYVVDEWLLGNIMDRNFEQLTGTETARKFIEVSKYIDPRCTSCQWASLCRGGCRRSREPFENGKPGINYYCKSFKDFFGYAVPKIQRIVETLPIR